MNPIQTLFICLFLLLPAFVHAMPETASSKPVPPGHDLSHVEGIVVQHGGRKKPLYTFARETMLHLAGRTRVESETGERIDAMAFVTAAWLGGADLAGAKSILLDHTGIKEDLGLDVGQKRFSYRELTENPHLETLFQRFQAHVREYGSEDLDTYYEKAGELFQRLELYNILQSGRVFTVVPHPTDPRGTWVTIPSGSRYFDGAELDRLNAATIALFSAYHMGPEEGADVFAAAAEQFRKTQFALGGDSLPSVARINTELRYEHVHPFRLAWILCLLSAFTLGLSWSYLRRPGLVLGWGFALGAFLLLILGMAARVHIAGRAPVTNMYETVIWVAFGLLFFSFIFEWRHRCRYYLLSGAPFAGILLILADNAPIILDPNIQPLTPVLRDNFWLTVHVLTVTISYAAFGLAFALGHFVLGRQIIKGGKIDTDRLLYAYIYKTIQIGILLLALGVILGAVWANYSWGRFWDWDPKETWSLIALLGYLFVLHGRLVGWWQGFGFSVGAVLGFQGILMCWYGVNFVLGAGLHSYGFGSGGLPYMVAFVIIELLFVGAAVWRRYVPALKTTTA